MSKDNLTDVYRMVDRLLIDKDVECALAVGRAFLLVKDYEKSLQVFTHIKDRVAAHKQDYYIILGNIAYSLTGLGKYDEAINYLYRVKTIADERNNGETFFSWHSIALAYIFFKKNSLDEFQKWIDFSKCKSEYYENVDWYCKLYPEIKEYLR